MNGMPRRFDAGKDAYAHEHRAHSGQDCRHIIANLTLLKYGADPRKYAAIAHQNYRMGGQHLNRSVELLAGVSAPRRSRVRAAAAAAAANSGPYYQITLWW
jgi:hypothetical protein